MKREKILQLILPLKVLKGSGELVEKDDRR